MAKNLKRPRDPISLAKMIGDIATGQVEDGPAKPKSALAVKRGTAGGAARAANLSPERRRKIAQKAAKVRWKDEADSS